MSKGERTRQAILSEALDQASVMGLEGLSIGSLAGRTGLSKSGLFAHFGSKEMLQIEVLKAAALRFAKQVIAPARREASGIGRLVALFRNWLNWAEGAGLEGGCIFLTASIELDDKAGAARDYLVEIQTNWLKTLAKTAERAAAEGDLRPGIDGTRIAYDIYGIYLAFHQAKRLLRDPWAEDRALAAFDTLIATNRHDLAEAQSYDRLAE